MKIQKVIFYIIKWLALVFLTVLSTSGVESDNKKIGMYILIGFVAVILIIEGRRDFRKNI